MKVFLGIKHFDDNRNKQRIEKIIRLLDSKGFETINTIRDMEKYGEQRLSPKELMRSTFKAIDNSDIVLMEMSIKGVGLGIEAGYANAKGKPIISICEAGKASLSKSMQGISTLLFIYKDLNELSKFFGKLRHES